MAQNAGRSAGRRLVISAPSTQTSRSAQLAPALSRSVRNEGQEVTIRPRTTPASINSHGAWQIAATGLPAATKSCTKPTAS